jgi:hypothetical protein
MRLAFSLLQVGSHNVNDVGGCFFRRFRIARHVVSDVVFHQLAHEAIDRTAGCGQALQRFGARLVFVECAKHAFELANDFLGAGDEIELFARGMRHLACIPYGGMVSRFRPTLQWLLCTVVQSLSALQLIHFGFIARPAFISQ